MKRLLVLVLAVVALGAAGCGGSCKDACESALACANALGLNSGTGAITQAACEDTCDAADCDNKSDVLKCVADDLVCTDETTFFNSLGACFLQSPACAAILP